MIDNTLTDTSVQADAAEAVRVTLANTLTRARTAGNTVLVKAYGAGADAASVGLARATATVLAGGKLPKGGTGTRVGAVRRAWLDKLAIEPETTLTAELLATLARTVLDDVKAYQASQRKAEKDTRAAAKATLNNRGESITARRAALDVMAEIDALPATRKADAMRDRVVSALSAARDAGYSVEWVSAIVDDVYPAPLSESDWHATVAA